MSGVFGNSDNAIVSKNAFILEKHATRSGQEGSQATGRKIEIELYSNRSFWMVSDPARTEKDHHIYHIMMRALGITVSTSSSPTQVFYCPIEGDIQYFEDARGTHRKYLAFKNDGPNKYQVWDPQDEEKTKVPVGFSVKQEEADTNKYIINIAAEFRSHMHKQGEMKIDATMYTSRKLIEIVDEKQRRAEAAWHAIPGKWEVEVQIGMDILQVSLPVLMINKIWQALPN